MEMYTKPHPLNDYLDRAFTCDCGREHYASLKCVSVKKDALEDLPVIAQKLGFKSLYLISDSITYKIAGSRCMELLAFRFTWKNAFPFISTTRLSFPYVFASYRMEEFPAIEICVLSGR